MQIYSHWHDLKYKHKKLVVGLGNFDGVHVGHQKLILELVNQAKEIKGTPAVFTFHPHPLAVLNPENCPPQLLSQNAKQRLIAKMGVQILLQVPFDLKLAGVSPESFVKSILIEELDVKGIVVGYNYTFGHRGRGTPALLEELSTIYGYQLKVIPPVMVEGQAVSSTLVRNLLIKGEVSQAAKYLGYYPFTEGQVVAGKSRGGSILGFPTANLELDHGILVPANGVYAAKVYLDQDTYLGVANIGVKPTFQDEKRNIEVHLLDFCQDLYGQKIKVSFTSRIRGEKRFASASDLMKQIERDIHKVRAEWSKARE
ncbi:bifunctional riboflavin kinase/FAD synthetase [Pelotomaculum propionicicum]|uniref:Riboflavin biosynthesis protein n=1 Tax=Pelotomaculum propionicicum TaxID=258475 RepID=A0A4Y7RMT8_9FIRM|nr:bifunctional riboflavin kinase/FAD synthetase [Pelotomaculum propionicicum]NLI11971.1 bifunctional riboflavin kinase/FAD synthetase [Peptococcaceae bacterium]TEB10183.1 Riboflavin biosynthesis protein RibF [Pelotomaculum propionicicum]